MTNPPNPPSTPPGPTSPPRRMPARIAQLPQDRHGRPIPWFVHQDPITGVPDFRVIGASRAADAHRFSLCWVCGHNRGRAASFVIGPMCVVNRVSSEPPSHLDCATYSAMACPFLSTPSMRRRDRDLGPLDEATAGIALPRNPGVAVVWTSRTWKAKPVPRIDNRPTAGVLWDVGDPVVVTWWREGRPATRAEAITALQTGLPALLALADQDPPAWRSRETLDDAYRAALALLPGA